MGSEILVSFYPVPWIPRRVSWMARITEFAWYSHFSDEQARGPFHVFHHRHGIAAEMRDGEGGTLVSDAIDFELPFGRLGRLGESFVRRQLENSFSFRHKRLPEILAAAQAQARGNL